VLGHKKPHKHIKVCVYYTHTIMCYKRNSNFYDVFNNLFDLCDILHTVFFTKDLV
jgi:hypothetical protein